MSYFITQSGRPINIATLQVSDIHLDDIAHHLSSYSLCRFGGALPLGVHYSVARHCINLYQYCVDNDYSKDVQRMVLLHDASEAYLGDLVTGLKKHLLDYRSIEEDVSLMIFHKFNVVHWDQFVNKTVSLLDSMVVLDEAKCLFPQYYHHFSNQMRGITPLNINIEPDTDPTKTKELFLECCERVDIRG